MRAMVVLMSLIVGASIAVLAQSNEPDEAGLGRASLDTVWQTVNEYHFDSTFGGVDWKAIHDRYDKLAAATKEDTAFIELMNQMLRELKVSHYVVFRVEDEARSGSPSTSEGSIGVEIRLLQNVAVITALDPDFPAAQAGMKRGYEIKSLNGESVQHILSEVASKQPPHLNERQRINRMYDAVTGRCFGLPGDTVVVTFEDENGVSHDTRLLMKQRSGGTKISEDFPTIYVDFKAERLAGNIGYIAFSAFIPPADSLFVAALDSMKDVRALVIDIRGNPGGMHEVGETIASKLVSKKTLFSVFQYRDSTVRVSLDPVPPVFEGPVAILINNRNASASERFSACMQSIGRAKVIGEQSSGSVGPSQFKRLPNGATLMYLVAQSSTPDGNVLEGRGVIPDITVSLNRKALLKGRDTQLERATEYLLKAR
jgi:carboxyl-terminal processing protease